MVNEYFDGRIPEELKTMNVELELRKLTEAYCIEHNIPITRRFTHEELQQSIERIREAIALQQPVEMPDFSPHVHLNEAPPSYWDEKAKDRREEFKEEDAHSRAATNP